MSVTIYCALVAWKGYQWVCFEVHLFSSCFRLYKKILVIYKITSCLSVVSSFHSPILFSCGSICQSSCFLQGRALTFITKYLLCDRHDSEHFSITLLTPDNNCDGASSHCTDKKKKHKKNKNRHSMPALGCKGSEEQCWSTSFWTHHGHAESKTWCKIKFFFFQNINLQTFH